jgi:hypothetical protein
MTDEGRCACAVCRALDALPERLQGWPGAWQTSWFNVTPPIKETETMSLPTFETDMKLRDACQERCAIVGDPPCWEVMRNPKPCGDCLRDVGIEPGDEFDETAAIGRML